MSALSRKVKLKNLSKDTGHMSPSQGFYSFWYSNYTETKQWIDSSSLITSFEVEIYFVVFKVDVIAFASCSRTYESYFDFFKSLQCCLTFIVASATLN